MNTRIFNRLVDYKTVCAWWDKHQWPRLPLLALPQTGIIAETEGGEPIAAGWLYLSDSLVSMIEWIVGNPDVSHGERAEGVDAVIDALLQEAKQSNRPMVFTSTKHEGLIERLKGHGFQVTEPAITQLLKA